MVVDGHFVFPEEVIEGLAGHAEFVDHLLLDQCFKLVVALDHVFVVAKLHVELQLEINNLALELFRSVRLLYSLRMRIVGTQG